MAPLDVSDARCNERQPLCADCVERQAAQRVLVQGAPMARLRAYQSSTE